MPDIRIVQNTAFPKYSVTCDWSLLADGTLDITQALATAIIVALGTDALASPDDILPDPNSTDRNGWWGNLDANVLWGGWDIGTKLWLMKRSKITDATARQGSTLSLIDQYIRDAIAPFVTARIGSSAAIEVARVGIDQINAIVRLYRGPKLEIALVYQILWDEIPRLEQPYPPYNIGRLPSPGP
jgi:phage gp46-like protein